MGGVGKAERKIMEAVAKHMRYKVSTKFAVIKGQKVEYFSGMSYEQLSRFVIISIVQFGCLAVGHNFWHHVTGHVTGIEPTLWACCLTCGGLPARKYSPQYI